MFAVVVVARVVVAAARVVVAAARVVVAAARVVDNSFVDGSSQLTGFIHNQRHSFSGGSH